MDTQVKIRVNIDSLDKIQSLFKINTGLADRIIEHREKRGFFYDADDLMQVAGIDRELASLISSQIDWQVPSKFKVKTNRILSLILVLYAILSFGGIGLPIMQIFGIWIPSKFSEWLINLYSSGTYISSLINMVHDVPGIGAWFFILRSLEFLIDLISIPGYFLGAIAFSSRTNQGFSRWIHKSLLLLVSSAILTVLSTITAIVGLSIFKDVIEITPHPSVRLLFDLSQVLFFGGIIAVLKRPLMLKFRWVNVLAVVLILVEIIYSFLLTGLQLFSIFDVGGSVAIDLNNVFDGLLTGFAYLLLGFQAISQNNSVLKLLKYRANIFSSTEQINQTYYLSWLGAHLPKQEDQLRLKETLDRVYTNSRSRNPSGYLIIAAAGWLAIRTLEAIWDYFVQDILRRFLNL